MEPIIKLTMTDLSISAGFVALLAVITNRMRLDISGQIISGALRAFLQLSLVGLALKFIFESSSPLWISVISIIMLLAASSEVYGRQRKKHDGLAGFAMGALPLMASSFTMTILALVIIIRIKPWYTPQYAIPMLGMLLGNTMTGIALGLDRLSTGAWEKKDEIEARLMLGHRASEAISEIKKDSIRSALIPIINSMSVAGLVSLPGMMTGQILGGNPPMEAVKYQILIIFLIACASGFGVIMAVHASASRLFDSRQRLRLDRLRSEN